LPVFDRWMTLISTLGVIGPTEDRVCQFIVLRCVGLP